MEHLKSNISMFGEISKKNFDDIDTSYVFELLKVFVGEDNPNYNLLSQSGLTRVNPGINDENSLKYIYSFGASLIQIKFFLTEIKKMYFSIKLLN